jgi:hypothetical protein
MEESEDAIAALLGATAGEAVIWYGGQFYALSSLTQTLKVPAFNAQILIALALAIGTPFFIVFGALSDKIGRKPIMLAGFLLAAVIYFYIFQGLTHFANPKLAAALAASPVTVTADPAECSFQFKPTGTEKFTSGCDLIKSALVNSSVNYNNVAAPPGTKRADRQRQHHCRYAETGRRNCRRRKEPRLPGECGPETHQLPDDAVAARHPRHLRDDGLRSDRGLAGGTVPHAYPL